MVAMAPLARSEEVVVRGGGRYGTDAMLLFIIDSTYQQNTILFQNLE